MMKTHGKGKTKVRLIAVMLAPVTALTAFP